MPSSGVNTESLVSTDSLRVWRLSFYVDYDRSLDTRDRLMLASRLVYIYGEHVSATFTILVTSSSSPSLSPETVTLWPT